MKKKPPEVDDASMDQHGKGLSDLASDNAVWLDLDPSFDPWIDALEAIDKRGDLQPLRDLGMVPKEVMPFLLDLQERLLKHKPRRPGEPTKPGRPRTPSYDLSAKKKRRLAKSLAKKRSASPRSATPI